MEEKPHILYGVLNWGLGHATRSVPVIRALLKNGFIPVIASDGAALEYLQKTFPDLPAEELPSYKVKYAKNGFVFNMVTQLPRIGKAVRQERQVVENLIGRYNARGIISDNRLGFYNPSLPSAFITHQLKIKLPFPASLANGIHHRYINNFSECWVPDLEGDPNLAGELTHSSQPDIPVRYIGPLSQHKKPGKAIKKYDVAVILSGPEPQRSILEESLLGQLQNLKGHFILIRGTQDGPPVSTEMEVHHMLLGDEVANLIDQSELVVSRSGYSSLMDYYVLQNKALLIPTPGQVEQEYLADYLEERQLFYSVKQNEVDLKNDMAKAMKYPGFYQSETFTPEWDNLFSLFKGKGKS